MNAFEARDAQQINQVISYAILHSLDKMTEFVGQNYEVAPAKHLTGKELDFTLYNSLVSYLGRSSFCFKSPPEDVLHLISGNVNFLNEKASMLRIKRFLYCSDVHHKYRRVLPH